MLCVGMMIENKGFLGWYFCVSIYIYIYIYMHIYIYIHIYTFTYDTYVWICVYIHIYIYIHVLVYAFRILRRYSHEVCRRACLVTLFLSIDFSTTLCMSYSFILRMVEFELVFISNFQSQIYGWSFADITNILCDYVIIVFSKSDHFHLRIRSENMYSQV